MQLVEYKTVRCLGTVNLQTDLNHAAREGWTLDKIVVTELPNLKNSQGFTLIFKRWKQGEVK